ncbi:MAG: hypothetical protein EAZ16_03400 [Sphingobacteriales bacterium]|jgi:hypothetical protein|nr:MAG: hypothetical protein EAZ16_03400 [Sphingobacteriales bacterium]
MKKLLFVLAIGALVTACNSGSGEKAAADTLSAAPTVDTTAPVTVDTAAAVVDTTKVAVDTTKK